jgi:hypothetical protein
MNLETNEREIQPITLWVNGQSYTASIFSLNGYGGYNFIDSPGEVQWTMLTYDAATDTKQQVMQGILPLTYDLVEDWGTDDQPIFDYAAQQLNIVLL